MGSNPTSGKGFFLTQLILFDFQELFGEYGELVRAHINYDRSGSSLGSADVVFKRKLDAVNAFKEYRGVNLDGNKMDIMFALDEVSHIF